MMKTITGLALAASACTGALAFDTPAAPAAKFLSCTSSVLPANARCGTLEVPENRNAPQRRKLDIHFAIAPGTDGAKLDPIYFIAGGPGQSAVDTAHIILPEIRAVDKRRDVVLIDQRGTGGSNPLKCADGFDLLARGSSDRVARCAASLRRSADLSRYLTIDAVEDLEALRAALGHPTINIAAASYGVRPALTYMRRHPSRVRTAILRAASAPSFNIISDGLGNAQLELDRVVSDCRADQQCRASYPRLKEQLEEVDTKLREKPERIAAPGGEIVVTPELFQQIMYAMMLSAPLRQQIPFIVSTAATKGFAPVAPLAAAIRDALYGALPVGMYLSILCSEDAPRVSKAALARHRTGIGAMATRLHQACRSWPKAAVRKDFFQPFRSQIPTLILSGEHDPATTYANADQLRPMLPNAKHILLRGVAHGPMFPPCVQAAASDLLRTGSTRGVNPDCSQGRLPAFRAGT
jgi:pimeloyl-ACP methyl ester carboxylesterase